VDGVFGREPPWRRKAAQCEELPDVARPAPGLSEGAYLHLPQLRGRRTPGLTSVLVPFTPPMQSGSMRECSVL